MNKIVRCIWLVELLMNNDNLTKDEIFARWDRSANGDSTSYAKRTFYRDVAEIRKLCGAYIKPNSYDEYSITNKDEMEANEIYQVFANAIKRKSLLDKYPLLNTKMVCAPAPTGEEKLEIIATAMLEKLTLEFTYQSYWWENGTYKSYKVVPHFVKEHKGRWYLIYTKVGDTAAKVAAFERMSDIQVGDKAIGKIPKITSAILDDCFGVLIGDEDAQKVVIKVYDNQVKYVRSLPLHPSQVEVETEQEYSIFQYHIRPTYDFEQELLWHRDSVEVIQPIELRMRMKDTITNMLKAYR